MIVTTLHITSLFDPRLLVSFWDWLVDTSFAAEGRGGGRSSNIFPQAGSTAETRHFRHASVGANIYHVLPTHALRYNTELHVHTPTRPVAMHGPAAWIHFGDYAVSLSALCGPAAWNSSPAATRTLSSSPSCFCQDGIIYQGKW